MPQCPLRVNRVDFGLSGPRPLYPNSDRRADVPGCPVGADCVAKARFAPGSKISAGCRRGFRVKMCEGPHRLTLNSQATSVTRLKLYELATTPWFMFSRKIRSPATFDFCNKICQERTSKLQSITLSAIAITPDGMVMPSALAVLRLITNSYLVACTTGRSAAFSPLRIRPT